MRELQKEYNLISPSFSRSREDPWPELEFLFSRSGNGEMVLDAGCGNGRFAKYLQHTRYTGMDFSEKMIKEAKKRFPEMKFIKGDVLSLPFSDNYFDKIYSIATIHHIPSRGYRINAFTEMKRALKPGGFLFITAWKKDRKGLFWKHLRRKFSPDPELRALDICDVNVPFNGRKRYYHLFKRGDLSFLARKCGLKVIEEGVAQMENRSNFYLIAQKPPTSKKLQNTNYNKQKSTKSKAPNHK